MEALVTRILELSSNEPDSAPDGIAPQNASTTDHEKLTPNPTHTYSSNGTNGTNDITVVSDSTGYSKVKSLVGNIPQPDQRRRQSSSCCSWVSFPSLSLSPLGTVTSHFLCETAPSYFLVIFSVFALCAFSQVIGSNWVSLLFIFCNCHSNLLAQV